MYLKFLAKCFSSLMDLEYLEIFILLHRSDKKKKRMEHLTLAIPERWGKQQIGRKGRSIPYRWKMESFVFQISKTD